MRIRGSTLFLLLAPFVLLIGAAYVQWAVAGLPELSPTAVAPSPMEPPQGFPIWLRATHYVNLLFMILLVRSGLQILMDHPRL